MSTEFLDYLDCMDFCEKSYLEYSEEVIKERAIPHIADGLKPVQRRIIYSMKELSLHSEAKHKKSARVVGDTIGKYHPHGDMAAYEAMVRMAQPFSLRYPLVDGQGNFGSLDGDSHAAMRYTEARLSKFAEEVLLPEINMGTVSFIPNYDGTMKEPSLFPSKLNLTLLNGSTGIAVGLTSDICSHNIREVTDATLAYIDNKEVSVEELMEIIKGPDFVNGGHVTNSKESILNAYKNGSGTFTVRAKNKLNKYTKGQWSLEFFEFPPNVSPSKIELAIDAILNPKPPKGKKDLTKTQINNKKLLSSMLSKVKGESDKNGNRVTIFPKTSKIDKDLLKETLYSLLPLEQTVKFRLKMINIDGSPRTLSIKEVISSWVDYRRNIIKNRSEWQLAKAQSRIHILEGRVIVFNNIDDVINIIKESENPKQDLMEKVGVTEVQADDILEIKLRSLAKLEHEKLSRELKALEKEASRLTTLLKSQKRMDTLLKKELEEITVKFEDGRRTLIEEVKKKVVKSEVDLTFKEDVTVYLSKDGWLGVRKGHGIDPEKLALKSATDKLEKVFECSTIDSIVTLSDDGRSHQFLVSELPTGKNNFTHIMSKIGEISKNSEIVFVEILSDKKYIFYSGLGCAFVSPLKNLETKIKNGKDFVTSHKGFKIPAPVEIAGDYVTVVSSDDRILTFEVSELVELAKGKGLQLMRLSKGAEVTHLFSHGDSINVKIGVKKYVVKSEEFDTIVMKRALRGKRLK